MSKAMVICVSQSSCHSAEAGIQLMVRPAWVHIPVKLATHSNPIQTLPVVPIENLPPVPMQSWSPEI
jgi:hypothetical protein